VDRRAWLAERRAATVAEYDAEAAMYEEHEYPVEAQRRFVARLLKTCLPAIRGEVIEDGAAGYHYYPGRKRVLGWIVAEGLEVVAEEYQHVHDAWGYRHFLLRAPAFAPA
jgi:hypothetical protein